MTIAKNPERVKYQQPWVRRHSLSRFLSGTKPGVSDERKQKAHLPRSIVTIPLYVPQYKTSAINKVSNRRILSKICDSKRIYFATKAQKHQISPKARNCAKWFW